MYLYLGLLDSAWLTSRGSLRTPRLPDFQYQCNCAKFFIQSNKEGVFVAGKLSARRVVIKSKLVHSLLGLSRVIVDDQ